MEREKERKQRKIRREVEAEKRDNGGGGARQNVAPGARDGGGGAGQNVAPRGVEVGGSFIDSFHSSIHSSIHSFHSLHFISFHLNVSTRVIMYDHDPSCVTMYQHA